MKTGKPSLYPNDAVAEAVTEYSEAHSLALPQHLLDYHAEIFKSSPTSNLMISTFQAQALVFLARMIGAKRVLEIGVYVGFSSMVWSHAVGPTGSVTGLEFSAEYAAAARAAFAAVGGGRHAGNIRVVEGDGLATLPALDLGDEADEGAFDLVFVDAQKSGYPAYLSTILARSAPGAKGRRLLRKGGLIIGDNALRRGLVAFEGPENPHHGGVRSDDLEAMRKFNDMVRDNERLESLMVPLWDGLCLARLVD